MYGMKRTKPIKMVKAKPVKKKPVKKPKRRLLGY